MNEFELIAKLTKSLPTNGSVVAGAGDDCAVLDLGVPDKLILFKTDAVVEGFHFTRETPPEKIGRKALARCLSDIAAMAGTPVAALVTLALPKDFDAEFVAKIYDGLNALAKEHGVAVVGGETTTSPGGDDCVAERRSPTRLVAGRPQEHAGSETGAPAAGALLISISLLGTVARGKQILRSGAKVGDAIFVTGELGGSLDGKHLEFEPRLEEARWLAEHFRIHALMDLSDGLAGDLGHILKASGVGAALLKPALPVSRAAKLRAKAGDAAKPALLAALTDGEDFELLFTVAAKDAVKLLDAWKKKFPAVKLSCIGKIIAGEGIELRDKNGAQKLNARGYVHFS